MRSLGAKFTFIAGLCFCFLIGLFFVKSIVHERQRYAQQAIDEIARDNYGAQTVMSPFIVVPVSWSICSAKEAQTKTQQQCTATVYQTIYTSQSQWHNKLKVAQNFRKGIYHATNYDNQISIQGRFSPDSTLLKPIDGQVVQWHKAKIYLAVSDLRGLAQQPVITLQDKKYQLSLPESSETLSGLPFGYTSFAIGAMAKNAVDFKLDFRLSGLQSFRLIPLGKSIEATLQANWAHPNFSGGISPLYKTISRQSTSAQWNNTYAPTSNSRLLSTCLQTQQDKDCEKLKILHAYSDESTTYGKSEQLKGSAESFNIQFFEPTNVYSLTDRTLKYALLFLLIIFGTFFLFEVLKGLQVHPIQYALVGAAQGVFYLLLLSFSEQFAFGWAYVGSSAACVLLISWYVTYVLKGIGRAFSLGIVLTAMYGTLYILLRSQQHTLMLGSVMVFALIAVVMFLTRHINWYQLNQPKHKL